MRNALFILFGCILMCSQVYSQKIARSYMGSFGYSVSGEASVVAFNPVSSPVFSKETFAEGRSIQTTPFLHLRSGAMAENIRVNIYPNPTTDWVNIETDEIYKEVLVVDVFGKICFRGWSEKISLKNVSSGLYTIHLTLLDNRIYTQKLIFIK